MVWIGGCHLPVVVNEDQCFVKVSEEAFEFFDTDWFFDKIAVSDEYGCGEDAILS